MSAFIIIKLTDDLEGNIDIEQSLVADGTRTDEEEVVGELLYHKVYDFVELFLSEEDEEIKITKKDKGIIQ